MSAPLGGYRAIRDIIYEMKNAAQAFSIGRQQSESRHIRTDELICRYLGKFLYLRRSPSPQSRAVGRHGEMIM